MKLKKEIHKEDGYLLLENIVTLIVLLAVFLMLSPLMMNWLVTRQERKEEVELSRVFYEASMRWPDYLEKGYPFNVERSENSLSVQSNKQKIEVIILDAEFEE